MNVEIRELTEKSARLVISGVTPPLVNAIRRTLLSDVPKMAIEDVEFHMGSIMDEEGNEYESAAPLFDEIIAHRLGLIPIPTDLERFLPRDKCTCGGEGCPNCTIIYSLNKRGPCTVYSGDLEPVGDKTLAVKDDLIPIVKLNKDQALLIYAIAELGTGRRHAKWQVCSAVGYKYYPRVTVDADKCTLCGDCVSLCPPKILEVKGKSLKVTEPEACTLCNSCVEVCPKDAIKVEGDDSRFILKFETDGSLSAAEAFRKALEILEESYEDFRTSLADIES
ncbi:MAG: DNA-directed RNA polymerase subunit D [Thermoplasmata archaeon]|nr:DNA-directed RNA polymerase subunit D [Thermoplasmata archaeon]